MSEALGGATSFGSRGHVVTIRDPEMARDGLSVSAVLEALLLGHELWVFSCRWHPILRTRSPVCCLWWRVESVATVSDAGAGHGFIHPGWHSHSPSASSSAICLYRQDDDALAT